LPTDPELPEFDRQLALAADRTILAREQAYGSWVRTGLAALAAAVGARTVLHEVLPMWFVLATGVVLAVFSAFCFAAAVWREVSPGFVDLHPSQRSLPRGLLIAINGFLCLVSAGALIGIVTLR
jgi:putative membrane protein